MRSKRYQKFEKGNYDPKARSQKYQRFEKEKYDPAKRSKRYQNFEKESYDPEARHSKHVKEKIRHQQEGSEETRILCFRHDSQYGPIFTCICCMRNLFRRSVRKITEAYKLTLQNNDTAQYLQTKKSSNKDDLAFMEEFKVLGHHHLCTTCCRYFKKS